MGDRIRKWIAVLLAGSILAMIQLVPAGGAVPPRYFPPNAAAAQDLHPICKDSVLQ